MRFSLLKLVKSSFLFFLRPICYWFYHSCE